MRTVALPDLGIHDAVPAAEYHAWNACSNSRLSNLLRSPAYCRWRFTHPDEPTPAKVLGTACHYAILQPEEVERVYVAAGQCEATTKNGRCQNQGSVYRGGGWYCRVKNHAPPPEPDAPENEDRIVLAQEDLDKVLRIRDAVHSQRVARALLARQVRREVSMLWDDDGLACKGRIDILGDEVVGDLKVTRDAHPDRFERFVGAMGLYRQAAFYLSGLRACGRARDAFVAVAVEPEPPHEVAVYALDPNAIRCGEEHVRQLVAQYRRCAESGDWPGYPPDVQNVSVPVYVARGLFPEEYDA